MDFSKFTLTDWLKIGAILFYVSGMYIDHEYMKGKIHEQDGKIEVMQNNEKNISIAQGVITQQLSDISQRTIRMENKIDNLR